MQEISLLVALPVAILASNLLDVATSSTPVAPDIGTLIQQMTSQFVSVVSQLLTAADNALIDITQLAFVTALILGLLLYFTHIHRRLGKDLIIGGLLLALMSEFAFPYLSQF